MNLRRMTRPSPALAVATVALFVALSGTAGAVVTAAVPLAKRALLADNAKKVGGKTAQQLVSEAAKSPGPASTATGLVVMKTGTWSLTPGTGGNFTATCDAGQKAIGGGWADPGDMSSSYQSLPTADGRGWTTNIWMSDEAPGAQTGTLYAVCVR
jgi:hypothetical protein